MNKYTLFPKKKHGIIIAADLTTNDALRNLAQLGAQFKEVVAIKVGFTLVLRYGLPAVVKAVSEVSTLPVIYDHQKAATDIPQMGQPFVEICRDAGVKGVIFFPHSGPKTLKSFVSSAFDCSLIPIVGLIMTHPAYLNSEGGFIADDAPGAICKLALDLGVKSFILPGTKPDVIRKFSTGQLASKKPVEIMMPGIGSQGGSIKDAFGAANGHHRFGIIGSAIYKVPDPKEALKQFIADIEG